MIFTRVSGQAVTTRVEKKPMPAVRSTCPYPPHVEQVFTDVPGSAPLPRLS